MVSRRRVKMGIRCQYAIQIMQNQGTKIPILSACCEVFIKSEIARFSHPLHYLLLFRLVGQEECSCPEITD